MQLDACSSHTCVIPKIPCSFRCAHCNIFLMFCRRWCRCSHSSPTTTKPFLLLPFSLFTWTEHTPCLWVRCRLNWLDFIEVMCRRLKKACKAREAPFWHKIRAPVCSILFLCWPEINADFERGNLDLSSWSGFRLFMLCVCLSLSSSKKVEKSPRLRPSLCWVTPPIKPRWDKKNWN